MRDDFLKFMLAAVPAAMIAVCSCKKNEPIMPKPVDREEQEDPRHEPSEPGALKECTVSTITEDMIFSMGCSGRTTAVQQGFDFSADKGTMYFSQVTSNHRNSLSWGPRQRITSSTTVAPNMMTLYYFSHGNNIFHEKGADGADYLWIGNYGTLDNSKDSHPYTAPQVLSKVKLVNKATVRNSEADDNYYFGVRNIHASFDVEHDHLAILGGGVCRIYRLSEVLATPVSNVTLGYEVTFGGEGAPDPQWTGKPVIRAHDCSALTPVSQFSYNYSPKGWQTFCIHGDRAYFFLSNGNPIGGMAYRSVIDILDLKGNILKRDIFQPFADNVDDITRFGMSDSATKYMENEGIIIRDGVMYLLYTAKNAAGIRRPVVFNLAVPAY